MNTEDKARTKWGWRQSGRLIVLVFLALDGAVCRGGKARCHGATGSLDG
ncbi:MAG: hypothetical protein WAK33_08220 [Silvibacterium sp.]